jgi:serine/threonine protein kinase
MVHTRRTLRASVRRPTRSKNTNLSVNALLGEGFHGKTYRLGATVKGDSLSKILEHKHILKIKLYTSDSLEEVYLIEKADIDEFVNFILSRKGAIAKVFKSIFLATGVTKQQDLEDELNVNRKIINYYGNKASKFLTIAPVTGFRNYKLVGFYATFAKQETVYVALGSECDNKYSMNINKFTVDILESLVVLQEAGYQHNDIKLDNIVRCKGVYKLIDWGQASSVEEFKFGDMICTNPIKWYINGFPSLVSRKLMDYRTAMVNSPYEKSDIFQEKNKQIIAEFKEIIEEEPDIHVLRKKYKLNLDVFMVGMTLLHAVFRYNLDYTKYRHLIDRLTSITHPWRSAKEALHHVKELIQK